MLKEKDKIVNEMMQLISNMNCSDSHCEDCFFKSHCCMCVGALELLYDNGYRKIDKDSVVFTSEEFYEFRKDQAEVKFLKKQIIYQTRKEIAIHIKKLIDDFILNIAKQLEFIEEKDYEK